MKIYIMITILCFLAFVDSIVSMLIPRALPPDEWGEQPYAKNKIALWLNKKLKNSTFGPVRISKSHFILTVTSLFLFVSSLVLLIIDLSCQSIISSFIGSKYVQLGLTIIAVLVFVSNSTIRIIRLRAIEQRNKDSKIEIESIMKHANKKIFNRKKDKKKYDKK